MSLTVTDARVDGEAVGLRAEGGRIVELGPGRSTRGPATKWSSAGGMPSSPASSTATPTPR